MLELLGLICNSFVHFFAGLTLELIFEPTAIMSLLPIYAIFVQIFIHHGQAVFGKCI